MTTLDHLGVDKSHMRANEMSVRVFDGTKSELIGGNDLNVKIDSCPFHITLHVS